MAAAQGASLTCPSCGRRYRWRDAFAGKQLQCKCGNAFEAPASDPQRADADDDASDLSNASSHGDAQPQAAGPAPPRVNAYAAAMGARSSVQQALETREDEVQPSHFRERYLPLMLLPIGWVGGAALWWVICPSPTVAGVVIGAALVLQVLVFVPSLLIAVSMVARWLQLGLGTLQTVLFKCITLTLGPAATADALFTVMMVRTDFDWWALAAGYAFYLIIFGIPVAIIYEMNVYETALAVLLNFVPRVIAVYTAALAFAEVFH